MSSEETSSGRDKGKIGFGNQGQDQIINDGHVVSGGMLFEAGVVFVEGDIAGIMQTILDLPVRAQHVE